MANPVIDKIKEDKQEFTTHGVRIQLVPVSASLMQEVVSRIKPPKIPIEYDESLGRDAPNQNSPIYQDELTEFEQKRARASIDTMAMFGIELVDGLPEDTKWLIQLKQMERLGYIDLSDFDTEDEIDLEFLFKRYIALTNRELIQIGRLTGIRQEDIDSSEAFFRREEGRDTD